MSNNDLEKLSKEEYDADTGTYMEDVHANDSIIGRDTDGNGLVDDVEKLIEAASKRADEYNVEQTRQLEKEHEEKNNKERQDGVLGM